MDFESRVKRVVEGSIEELQAQIIEARDWTLDYLPYLQKLVSALPLLEDVKTEVANIEKRLTSQPEKKDDDDGKRKDKPTPTLEDQRVLQELLESLQRFVPQGDPDQLLLPGGGTTPLLDSPFNTGEPGLTKAFLTLANMMKGVMDRISDYVARDIATSHVEDIRRSLRDIERVTAQTFDQLYGIVQPGIRDCQDRLQDLADAMSECCDNMTGGLQQSLDGIDRLQRSINTLNPERTANQDLAIIQREKQIANEIFSLRGLL